MQEIERPYKEIDAKNERNIDRQRVKEGKRESSCWTLIS